jgi:hypothetical protein
MHCYKYLYDSIKHNCKIFQNTLKMEFNDNIEENSNENLKIRLICKKLMLMRQFQ